MTFALILFLLSSILTIISSIKLTHYADSIADHTSLGHSFVGIILLSASTSLPELFSSSSASFMLKTNLSFGNIFGSNMTNIFILVILDLFVKKPILSLAHPSNLITGSLVILNSIPVLLLLLLSSFPSFPPSINQNFWFFSPAILISYLISMKIIVLYTTKNTTKNTTQPQTPQTPQTPHQSLSSHQSKKRAFLGFFFSSILVFAASISLSYSSNLISQFQILGKPLGNTFVGTLLMALTTSLPEIIVSISAIKIQSFQLALGNIFGSNLFNILILSSSDISYQISSLLQNLNPTQSIVHSVSQNHLISGLFSIILLSIALVSISFKKKSKSNILHIPLGIDTFSILIFYLLGFYLLFILR